MNIGLGITGSFCTHKKILEVIKELKNNGHDILPILTEKASTLDTRFGTSKNFLEQLERITNNKPICNIIEAEPIGPKNLIDILVIAPCTGNTLGKLANAITDNAVTMTAKSLMRNNKKVVIGVSTNDALGLNLENIAKLLNSKNIYFIPFYQDDIENKPKSLISDWSKIEETINLALNNKQIQPLMCQKQ